MSIRFQCECGKTLRASDDHGGLEGQCPACGKIVTIPQAGALDDRDSSQEDFSAQPVDERETVEEPTVEIEGLKDLERNLEGRGGDRPDRGSWARSSRFAMLASIVVVVVVALIVFMVVRREKETSEELVIIKPIEPLAETVEEAPLPPVGALLEEAQEPSQPAGPEPVTPGLTEGGIVEEAPMVSAPVEEAEPAGSEKSEEVATIAPTEGLPSEETRPIGAYTVNMASFKDKDNAERYAAELKTKGIDAFDWEVDLPQTGKWYRVSVGGFATREEAETYAKELKARGISDTFITKVPGA